MMKDTTILAVLFVEIIKIYFVQTNETPSLRQQIVGYNLGTLRTQPNLDFEYVLKPPCLLRENFIECKNDLKTTEHRSASITEKTLSTHNQHLFDSIKTDIKPLLQKILLTRGRRAMNVNQKAHTNNIIYPVQGPSYMIPNFGSVPKFNILLNNVNIPYNLPTLHRQYPNGLSSLLGSASTLAHQSFNSLKPYSTGGDTESTLPYKTPSTLEKFMRSLDYFERRFYMVTFTKLTSISPPDRRVNGMSFVQSGFFLMLTLMTLSPEVDLLTKAEIDGTIGFYASENDMKNLIHELMSSLPADTDKLKFRRTSRMMLWSGHDVTIQFRNGIAAAFQLNIETFNSTDKPEEMFNILNQRIEMDSGGAIRDTFDENDLPEGVTGILMTTLYFRARWRSAPTVLNDTRPFSDSYDAPKRTVRMIKLNDIMGYADIKEWNAQALEIFYASPDLSIVIVVPRTPSLRRLSTFVTSTSIANITSRMKKTRVEATLPLYTLRMTLLLPNKLKEMGVSRLFDTSNLKPGDPLRLSHMVQRLMFWAEAGRNAYKDDGIAWDETPDLQILIDRPYIFFVRWRNLTLMNGNFVL